MSFSEVSEILALHLKMGRMEIRPFRILIIFLNLISQSVHGIFRCLFSLSKLTVHVSDLPFSADHVWNDDPCGCSVNAQ